MKRSNRKHGSTQAKTPKTHPSGGPTASVNTAANSQHRRWLFRFAAMTIVPVLLLAGLELGLRLAGYGYDPDFFLPLRIGGEDYLVQNENFSRRFFPGDVSRQPSALRMKAHKPPGSIRIFVLGESAAMGDPEPSFGPSRHLETLLRLRFPQTQFEVVNVAYTAINSHVILPIARECAQHDGDLWIVYMGNNEMVGPFGAATVFGAQSPPRNYVRLSLAVQRTRIGQLSRSLAARFQKQSTGAPSWAGMQMFLQNQVAADSPKRADAYKNFAGNLDEIVSTGLNSGARVVLNTMAVNLRASPPFASLGNNLSDPANRTKFEAAFALGLQAMTNDAWAVAVESFGKATELDPEHADAHYNRAICLEQAGDSAMAQKEYQLACDTDALPFRADSHINAAIRATADKQKCDALQLLNAPEAIARATGVTPCGDETFYEHVHFNFDGSYRMGLAWAQAVESSLATNRLGSPAAGWAAQDASERMLALTDWNRKLITASVVQRLQQPPLSSQPNNPARVARMQQREQQLLGRMNREAVERAREIYAAAIKAQPEDHFLHEVHGNFLQVTSDLPGALRAWQRTAELMPHDFLPWFQMGVLQAQQNQHSAAQKNFRAALSRRPGLVEGWLELARSLTSTSDWLAALEAFDHALRLRPQDPMFWVAKAGVLMELGRRTEASEVLSKALALDPNNAAAAELLRRISSARQ